MANNLWLSQAWLVIVMVILHLRGEELAVLLSFRGERLSRDKAF